MKTIVFAMLQVILASGILYGYYHIMLRNKKFHQYNRFYLLGAAVISVLIPFLNIPVYFAESEIQSSVVLQTLQSISSSDPENEVINISSPLPEVATPFNWNIVLYAIYALAVLLFLVRILISLNKIRAIIRNNPVEELEGVCFVNTTEPGTPYSFFHWLFWNKKIELRSDKGEQIFRHEIYHIQQKHSLDILFMELLTVIFWINPFFHLVKKEVKAIHEFLADRFAINENNKWEYAELLLMQVLNTKQQLVTPFFHNQIKRRIAMITTSKKPGHQYLRKLMVFPVAAIVVALFAFSYKKKQANENAQVSGKPLTVVIDAGHGGTDKGVLSLDKKYSEAQITLEIARQIQSVAKEYNINVIMTREDDKFPGNTTNKEDGLRKRVEIANEIKPDAFIAIHVNVDGTPGKDNQTNYSGFEAYVSDKREDSNGRLLASAILNSLSPVYKTSMKLNQRKETGVYILDHNNYPAVLLECGYINNERDLAFITKKENQEKIARNILAAVISYTSNQIIEQADILARDTVPGKINNGNPETTEPLKIKEIIILPPTDTSATQRLKLYHKALVVIDGKIEEGLSFYDIDKKINSGDIESINVLKNEMAKIKYGEKGKNGVIEVITKKAGNLKVKEIILEEKKPDNPNIIFEKVDIDPSFPGGEAAWKKYLERNLDATIPVKNNARIGEYSVFIKFIVHKDGHVSDAIALTNHGFGMETEALRIIKKGPSWSPAIQNGKTVNAYKKQRIDFNIRSSDKTTQSTGRNDNAEINDYSSFGNRNYNAPEYKKWRQNIISEVIAFANIEGKAAYEYKGRTYIFVKIADPDTNSYVEIDGIHHSFLLNGRLVNSIAEINNSYTRKDIRSISLLSKEESNRKYNLDVLASIETFDKELVSKK